MFPASRASLLRRLPQPPQESASASRTRKLDVSTELAVSTESSVKRSRRPDPIDPRLLAISPPQILATSKNQVLEEEDDDEGSVRNGFSDDDQTGNAEKSPPMRLEMPMLELHMRHFVICFVEISTVVNTIAMRLMLWRRNCPLMVLRMRISKPPTISTPVRSMPPYSPHKSSPCNFTPTSLLKPSPR